MKKNYILSDIGRACASQRFVACFNLYLPPRWLFHLACVISAFLLSVTDTQAATITVTNGNDSGPGSLRQAILNGSPGDTITFAPSVTIVNLTSDELVIDKNLAITGPGANRLTIKQNTNYFRVFEITNGTVTISGLTISNGSVVGGDGSDGDGGGIRNAGVLMLADCAVSGNEAYGLEFVGGDGGGVFNDRGTMTITRCTISNNSARYSTNSSSDCAGGSGGGITNYSGSVTISNSTISGNSCVSNDGFGLCGGGGHGGGVANGGSMTITNCTISGNSGAASGYATMKGGGISNFGNLHIKSSTIAYNSTSGDNGAVGGGIYGSGQTIINSSILALNSAPTGPDFTGAGVLNSSGYNIIGNNADAVIDPSHPTDQIGTPGAPIDPRLGSLSNNGGPTFTHALQPGSPAINRGNPSSPSQDQRGYGRVGVPDVGAFEFGGGPVPTATTNAATNIASFAATLNGTVNPIGLTAAVHFQYGTTTSYGSTTANQTFAGSATQNVIANIAGLSAGTTYHFRIVATNSHGIRYGSDRTFTTLNPTGPPVVYTNPATVIASFSATLNGTVDPHGLATTIHFQYGTTTSYGLTTAPQSKSGNTYQNVFAYIGGLTVNTTYHFRIVATNSAGTRYGADRTFTTLSATGPPVAITNPATNVATSSATLNGTIDPHGLSTSVHFQYGTTTSYGSATGSQTKTGNAYQNVASNISGLSGRTTYHFRIVAANTAGTTYGSDRTFITP